MAPSWLGVLPKELFDEPIIKISGDETLETACELLISHDVSCLFVNSYLSGDNVTSLSPLERYEGLFDYADMNTFLLLALGAYTPPPDSPEKLEAVFEAVKSKRDIPVRDACNLSDKNPLVFLSPSSNILELLEVYSRGTHRVAIKDDDGSLLGLVSDRRLIRWFADNAPAHFDLKTTLQLPLSQLNIGLSKHVVSLPSDAAVLEAMQSMNDEGVSSIAVLDATGSLLSAVSTTDIGKLVGTSENKSIISTPLSQFISLIKVSKGTTTGEDKFPIYSVGPESTVGHAVQVLLATNAHRVYLNSPFPSSTPSSPSLSPIASRRSSPSISSLRSSGSVYGIVSVIDILSVIARVGGVENVDPNSVRRHRRSSSSVSATSSGFISRRISRFSPTSDSL